MMNHTDAYGRFRVAIQSEFDAILLFSHAIPALKAYMKAVDAGEPGKIPDPDHFEKPQPHSRLKNIIPRYRKVLGRMLFLSSFSYFEAYFKDMIREVIAFHGGKEKWQHVASKRSMASMIDSPEVGSLREPMKLRLRERYRN